MAQKTMFFPRCRLLAVLVAGCFAGAASALPTGVQVAAGNAAIGQTGNLLTINNSANAILNWQQFSIGSGEAVRFNQPSADSSVLNRVLGTDPSSILGQLSSNGRVWLVNPAGILVGPNAHIDTAAFVASTLNISNENFLAGKLTFGGNANAGSVVNQGFIATPGGGSVYLVAPNVRNEGIITTPKGETILAAGQTVQLVDTATPGVKVEVTGAEGNATNLGSIVAEAGRVGMAGVLVRNSGSLSASSVVNEGGRIFLKASQDTYVEQNASVQATGSRGGRIEALGNRVAVTDNAVLDASGTSGGGSVLVGGDLQGKNPAVQNAAATYFGPQASIRANATTRGDGGKVIVWADETTRAYGNVSARGGAQGGDGGFAEISGKRHLDFRGRADLRAPYGKSGTLLLDPNDITIQAAGTTDVAVSGAGPYTFDGGPVSAILTTADLQAQLALGNVSITTATGAGGTGNITVADPVSWAFANALSLRADNAILIGAAITGSDTNALLGMRAYLADITQTAPISVPNLAVYADIGSVTLNHASNAVSKLAGYAGGGTGFKFASTLPLTVDALTANLVGNLNGVVAPGLPIELKTTGGNLTVFNPSYGVTATGGSVTLDASGAIIVDPASMITANQLKMTSVGGVSNGGGGAANTDVSSLNVLNTGAGAIKISNSNRNLSIADIGAVGYGAKQQTAAQPIIINNEAGFNISVNAPVLTDGADIVLKGPTGLTLAGGQSISTGTGSANITLAANNMSLVGGINAGTSGGVLLTPYDVTQVIDLGGADAGGTLGLTNAELGTIVTRYLTIGDGMSLPTAGLTVSNAVSLGSVTSLTLNNAGGVNINAPVAMNEIGSSVLVNASNAGTAPSLNVGAGGGISTTGDGSHSSNITLVANGMTLGGAAGSINPNVGTTTGEVTLDTTTSTKPIVLGYSGAKDSSVALQLTPADLGSITAGKLTVGGVNTSLAGHISVEGTGLTLNNVKNLNLVSGLGVSFPQPLTLTQADSTLSLNAYDSGVTQNVAGVITANHVQIDNGANVTLNTAANSVNSIGGTINPAVASSIAFKNDKGLAVSSLTNSSTPPSIFLQTTSGSLSVGTITANGGTVTLNAAESIVDTNGVANNVTANTLSLTAGNGMSLDTTVSSLSASNAATNDHGIGIRNTGNLTLTSMSDSSVCGAAPPAACTGPAGIKFFNSGTVNISGAVSATGANGPVVIGADGNITQTGAVSGYFVGLDAPSLTVGGAITANDHAGVLTDNLVLTTGSITATSGAHISTRTASKTITIGNACVTAGCLLLDDLTTAKINTPELAIGRDVALTGGFKNAPVSGAIDIKVGVNRGAGKIAFLSNDAIIQDVGAGAGIIADTVGAVSSGAGKQVSLNHAANQIANILGEANGGAFSAVSASALAVNDYADPFDATNSVAGISTANGAVTLTASSIEVASPINAGTGNVVLSATGAITVDGAAITGTSLTATAGAGIGAAGFPLQTNVGQLSLTNTGAGDIRIENKAGTPGPLTVNLASTAGSGAVVIDNHGSMTTGATQGAAVNGTTVPVHSGSGAIALTAHSPLTIGTGGVSTSGNVTLTAGAAASSNTADLLTINGPINTTGSITLAANAIAGSSVPTGANVTLQLPPPTVAECTANPSLSGCGSVLPSLAACTSDPTLAGCTVVLPSLATCIASPTTAGCTAVLPSLATCAASPTTAGCSVVLPTLATCIATPTTAGCAAVLPSLASCTASPTTTGCAVVLPSLATCTASPTTAGCSVVLPTLASCIAAPTTAGCTAVLPSLVSCTASPNTAGCTVVLPSLAACTSNPTAAGCTAVLPTLATCTATPATTGCSAVLPSLATCTIAPTTAGCAVVLPSLATCTTDPITAGCTAVLPSLAACTTSPTTAGCAVVLPSLATCTTNPANAGCSTVLPSLATCTVSPATAGCTAVLPPLSSCTTDPTAAGCSAVLPSLAACTTLPTTPGCTAVLPSLASCTVNPVTAGCSVVLPPLSECTSNPAAAGCIAVLPSLATCTTTPTAAGCTAVLPSLASCTASPATAGCTAVLPSLSACTTNPVTAGCGAVLPSLAACTASPATAGCTAVLPTLSDCTLNPTRAGCSAVLPSLATCTASPTAAGCSAVLPSLASCSSNPALAGCSAVLPPKAAETATTTTNEVVAVVAAATSTTSESGSTTTTPAAPPPLPAPTTTSSTTTLALLNTNQTIGGTEGTFGGTPTTTSSLGTRGTLTSGAATASTTSAGTGTASSSGSSTGGTPASTSTAGQPGAGEPSSDTGGSASSSSGGSAAESETPPPTKSAAADKSSSDKSSSDKSSSDKPASDKGDKAAEDKKDDKKEKEEKKEGPGAKKEERKVAKKPALCN